MDEERLRQYLEGELDASAREEVVSWIESDPEHFARFSRLEQEMLFAGMEQDTLDEEEAVARLAAAGWPGEETGVRPASRWLTLLTRVAAILLIPLAVAGILLLSQRDREITRLTAEINAEHIIPIQEDASWLYTVNPGVKGDVTLPDGSRVRLNSSSTLRCPTRFADASRVVELSGEGFFEVESNPDWPMYVKTSKGATVKVTGTRFNISSYDNDDALKLTLVEGSVTLIDDASGKQFAVAPDQEMSFYYGETIRPVRKAVDVQPAIVWKDGVLLFENTQMMEVVKRLERWYGVSIAVQDPSILQMKFTASFESESLTQVLQLLGITSNIGYRIQGREVVLFKK